MWGRVANGLRSQSEMIELHKKSFLLSTFAMLNAEKISYRESPAERKRRWNKLNEKHGAPLEECVMAIRSGPWGISRAEARVAAMGKLKYDCLDTAIAKGLDEHTVRNHRASILGKMGISAKQKAFDMLFLQTAHPPPQENSEK
jgi:DNA-binding CsgD family transcriptional regulator